MSYRPREERRALILSARMLADHGWRDVTVRNVSSQGMMLRCEEPPARNTFVEIRHQKACIVGRVIWSNGTACGINTQDKIDLSALLSQRPSPRMKSAERRAEPRGGHGSVQMRALTVAESNRRLGSLFEWSAVALAVAVAAVSLADIANGALQQPVEAVGQALRSQTASR